MDDGEQTSAIEPKSVTESQFSSVMSYHEGDSTPLRDPSTDSQELSKSLDEESTEELASGTINQEDDSSHDIDVFASDTEKSSSQSVQDDSSVQNSNIVPSVEEMNQRMLYLLKLLNLGGLVEKENRQLCMVAHCCTLLPAS